MADLDPNIIILRNVRLRYEALFEPRAKSEDKPDELSYQATVIMDNVKHAKLLDKIEAVTDRVALDEFKSKVKLKYVPLRDGNDKPDTDGFGDGVHYLSANRKTRPGIADQQLNDVRKEDGEVFYPGCFVNLVVRLFAWSHKTGGKGVSADFLTIQKVADCDDDERFQSGASTRASDYLKPIAGDEDDEKPAARSTRSGRQAAKPSASVDDF